MKQVFIVGGTGYIGTRLIKKLLVNGHSVTALVRSGSENKVPEGAKVLVANPFESESFVDHIPRNAVFIQLLGVAHPSPRKHAQFISIDLKSAEASVKAAKLAAVSHFIYVSVAMVPSAIMRAYQRTRKTVELNCIQSNLPSTFIRPWYVTGPGHYWPILLMPFYGIAQFIPSLRKKAAAFGLVNIDQMIQTLANTVDDYVTGNQILEIADIRKSNKKNAISDSIQ